MSTSKESFNPGGKSKYAHRKKRRLNDGPMEARQTPPWFFEFVTRDFQQREREAERIRAAGKSTSNDPMRPWGEKRSPKAVDPTPEEVGHMESMAAAG